MGGIIACHSRVLCIIRINIILNINTYYVLCKLQPWAYVLLRVGGDGRRGRQTHLSRSSSSQVRTCLKRQVSLQSYPRVSNHRYALTNLFEEYRMIAKYE